MSKPGLQQPRHFAIGNTGLRNLERDLSRPGIGKLTLAELVTQMRDAQVVFVFEKFCLELYQTRLSAEEFFGLPGNSGILPGGDGCHGCCREYLQPWQQ